MSFDISLVVDTGGESPACVDDVGSPTYNIAPMFVKALGFSLRDLDGRNAGECIADLERAVSHIRHPDNRAEYVALNPPNGWGNHDNAAASLESLLAACRRHPKTTVHIT